MRYDIPDTSISEIAEGIILDYLGDKAKDVKCIDIEGLLVDYFKLNVVYENFAEDDPNKDGFIADGKQSLLIWKKNRKTTVVYPSGTVVFDKYLLRPEISSHRRFCLAHEGAHYVFGKENADVLGTFHRSFDNEYKYSFKELKALFSLHETQANSMGGAFLVPRFLAERTMKEFFQRKRTISIFGESTMIAEDRQKFVDMANQLGVSAMTLLIQLRQYNMIKYCSMDALVKEMKKRGGWGGDTCEYCSEIPD